MELFSLFFSHCSFAQFNILISSNSSSIISSDKNSGKVFLPSQEGNDRFFISFIVICYFWSYLLEIWEGLGGCWPSVFMKREESAQSPYLQSFSNIWFPTLPLLPIPIKMGIMGWTWRILSCLMGLWQRIWSGSFQPQIPTSSKTSPSPSMNSTIKFHPTNLQVNLSSSSK